MTEEMSKTMQENEGRKKGRRASTRRTKNQQETLKDRSSLLTEPRPPVPQMELQDHRASKSLPSNHFKVPGTILKMYMAKHLP